jgi:hypothetical protein
MLLVLKKTCGWRIKCTLQGAAGEPGAGVLEGGTLDDREAGEVLIEGERPWEISDDERNVMELKLSHSRRR